MVEWHTPRPQSRGTYARPCDRRVARVLGDTEGREAVEDLLAEQKAFTRDLLDRNRHLVEALRDALLERSELIGHEITDVLDAAKERREKVIDLRERADSPVD